MRDKAFTRAQKSAPIVLVTPSALVTRQPQRLTMNKPNREQSIILHGTCKNHQGSAAERRSQPVAGSPAMGRKTKDASGMGAGSAKSKRQAARTAPSNIVPFALPDWHLSPAEIARQLVDMARDALRTGRAGIAEVLADAAEKVAVAV